MALHPYNKGLHNHSITAKTYLTEAARDLDLGWQSTKNIHKTVFIVENASFQILESVGPAVWQTIGSGTQTAEAGLGITAGVDTKFGSGVERVGSLFKTTMIIDLDGLRSKNTDFDIIGKSTGGAASLGSMSLAKNGEIVYAKMTCLEVPAGGQLLISLWAADEATGVYDSLITALTNDAELLQSQGDGTAWAVDDVFPLTAFAGDGQFLYLVSDTAGTDGEYTAGKFLIEFWGV